MDEGAPLKSDSTVYCHATSIHPTLISHVVMTWARSEIVQHHNYCCPRNHHCN